MFEDSLSIDFATSLVSPLNVKSDMLATIVANNRFFLVFRF